MSADIDAWVRQWRAPMFRFALLHLSSRDDAEDAVQDAFTAVLLSDPDVLAAADPRRYLFGVLRNKVMDRLRQRYRHAPASSDSAEDLDALLFDAKGHWLSGVAPCSWRTPEDHHVSDHFFRVLDVCISHLPQKPARVFTMKEFMECDADEICATLGISKPDYWQSMSRARKQIHLCLNERWFGGETLP